MPGGQNGVIKHNPRTGELHDLFDLFLHGRLAARVRTAVAVALNRNPAAVGRTCAGVVRKSRTLRT